MRLTLLFCAFIVAASINLEQVKSLPIASVIMLAIYAAAYDVVEARKGKDK